MHDFEKNCTQRCPVSFTLFILTSGSVSKIRNAVLVKERHVIDALNIGSLQLNNACSKMTIPKMQCCLHYSALGLAIRVERNHGLAFHYPTTDRTFGSTKREQFA